MTPREMLDELEHSAERLGNNGLRGMRVEIDWIRAMAQWVRELEARAEKAEAALMKSSEFCPGEFPCEASMHASEYWDRMTRAEARVEKLREVLRPLAKCADLIESRRTRPGDEWYLWSQNASPKPNRGITVADARRARAALAEMEEG